MAKKYVYFFGSGKADGDGKMKALLGGKGAGLAEMTNIGANVPPGFTITTEVCKIFYINKRRLPEIIKKDIDKNLERIEKVTNKKFGDFENPLLVSVRSGAMFSMPGMMDTILNLGLNDKTVEGLAKKTNNERFAYDCYRRFIAMFGNVVMGIDKKEFEEILENEKKRHALKYDTDMDVNVLKNLVARYKEKIVEKNGREFPQDPRKQLSMARDAVFLSWNNSRARYYRKQNNIPDDLGTAVNIQTMVFGNMGENSATGVGFTRDPSTGEKEFYGEYLRNAQGEDVVAGIRTPKPILELENDLPIAFNELKKITNKLEKHYRDVQDFEFTIEQGKLYMLQTRNGKRTTKSALKIAVDMVKEGLITKEEALLRIEPQQLDQLLHPIIDPNASFEVIAKGLPASPGSAVGKVVFDSEKAIESSVAGHNVILVRKETNPDDIHGMDLSRGILTAKGGMTSHAAVVARQMGRPCVAGCESLEIDEHARVMRIDGKIINEGDFISIDGSTGNVILGKVPLIPPSLTGDFNTIMSWADNIRRLKIRTNADTPKDAKLARSFGAEGIGLCRTEHMFFAEDRIPIMQKMIMAKTTEEREEYLEQLLPMQKEDFKGIFREMSGLPVTIRLLDPPLHEFLPKREELMVELCELKHKNADPSEIAKKEELLNRVEDLHEFNPMLGLRGCRLGITMPEVSRMQARAIIESACEIAEEGIKVIPEIMIPVVSLASEMKAQKELVLKVAKDTMKKYRKKVRFTIGTMIELPRSAITADEIAREAEFFSFGTNDLTQTTFGFSRDDAGKFIRYYMETSTRCPECNSILDKDSKCLKCGIVIENKQKNILERDPFSTLDQIGVGGLISMAVEKGRKTRKDLKIGICGEHGGDPASIEFCNSAGLNYVSCSPYRVPIARLSAAQAVLKKKQKKTVGD